MRCLPLFFILIPVAALAQTPVDSLSDSISQVLIQENIDLQPLRRVESKTWLFYTLLIPVILFAYVSFNFRKDLLAIWVAFFNRNLASQLQREQEATFLVSGVILNLSSALVLAHYSYFLISYFKLDWGLKGISLLGVLYLLILGVYLFRFWSLKLQAWIFPFHKELTFYNFQIFLVHKILGLLFLPIVIFLAFAPSAGLLIWPSIVFGSGIIFYRYFRAFQSAQHHLLLYKFHFFLYLCASEAAPVLWVIKVLSLQQLL